MSRECSSVPERAARSYMYVSPVTPWKCALGHRSGTGREKSKMKQLKLGPAGHPVCLSLISSSRNQLGCCLAGTRSFANKPWRGGVHETVPYLAHALFRAFD